MRDRSNNRGRLVGLLLGFLALDSGATLASVGPLPDTDRELSRAVSARLGRDPRLSRYHIRVTADAGALRLSGSVPTLRVAVLHLMRDPYVFPVSGRIQIETRDGMFVLTGTVPRLIDKMEALDVAALVVDRERIQDELLIDPSYGRLQRRSAAFESKRTRTTDPAGRAIDSGHQGRKRGAKIR